MSRALAWILLALSASACVDPPSPSTTGSPDKDLVASSPEDARSALGALTSFPVSPADAEGLEISLTATAPTVAAVQRSTVSFELRIQNNRASPIANVPLSGRWLVNGALDLGVQMAFVNGAREGDWESLAPGATLSIRRSIGDDVLPGPGAWVLSYEHGDRRGAARVIVVADAPADRGLAWWLEADPPDLMIEHRARLRLRVHVMNTGPRVVEPRLEDGAFTINGDPAPALGAAFLSGLREAGWASLTPGQTAMIERAVPEALLGSPGYHEIRYTRDDATDAGVTVTLRRNRADAVPR